MKNDPRLTIKRGKQRYGRPTLTLAQLAHTSVVGNITMLLRQIFIAGSGYTGRNMLGLLSDLPTKIGRSKDLGLILTKIAKLSAENRGFSPFFSDTHREFKINRKSLYRRQIDTAELVVEILSSNRNPFLKLALLDLIRVSGMSHQVCDKLMGASYNQVYYYEVEASNKTFDTLIQNENMLDLLRDDSYMSGILTKFKLVSASIEQADPALYRIASECITDILGADSTLSALQPYLRFLKEWSKVDDEYKQAETFEARYNLDCGCEHQSLQSKDELIGEIVFMLYKTKAPAQ